MTSPQLHQWNDFCIFRVMDRISKSQRSANMRAVRGKNTGPEIAVRKAAHQLGLRFRLHRRHLPGCPDLVFPRWKTVLFVNGCFWHGHRGCRRSKLPASNVDFWREKLAKNARRDRKNYAALRKIGWHVEVIWQCQIADDLAATKAIERISIFGLLPGQQSGARPIRSSGAARCGIKHTTKENRRSARR
ncbi:very short patch repair endonuclease [Bradyrhizobium sp. 482_C4_N1_1]|uniref:very short patch repair endonuclease n=1 Tax=unclassified Bradyrhizobium TaxID=2631580 RepID=UPI003F8939E5